MRIFQHRQNIHLPFVRAVTESIDRNEQKIDKIKQKALDKELMLKKLDRMINIGLGIATLAVASFLLTDFFLRKYNNSNMS